jgi:hypothetical protein
LLPIPLEILDEPQANWKSVNPKQVCMAAYPTMSGEPAGQAVKFVPLSGLPKPSKLLTTLDALYDIVL